jgi:hypothetical protein
VTPHSSQLALSPQVSNVITFFDDLINLIGAVFGMATVYFFPCFFSLRALPLGTNEQVAIRCALAFAIVASVIGTVVSLISVAQDITSEGKPFGCGSI